MLRPALRPALLEAWRRRGPLEEHELAEVGVQRVRRVQEGEARALLERERAEHALAWLG